MIPGHHAEYCLSYLDPSACPYDLDALVELYPENRCPVVPVKGIPKGREQFGSVLYECDEPRCSADLTAGGHGFPYFLRLWASTPPRDPIPPETLEKVLSTLKPTSVSDAEEAMLPQIRARYDGLYADSTSITITRFADPPGNGPPVRTCSSCGSRLKRHPVYVWPDDFQVPLWWQTAVEEYKGPVISPKGPTEDNPVVSDDTTQPTESQTQSKNRNSDQLPLDSF